MSHKEESAEAVAVIGMAGRFSGAADLDDLWEKLVAGTELIERFGDDELRAAGVPAELLADSAYVKAGGVLAEAESFDAEFFGFTPREAELMDPQIRLFLETAFRALESAGYAPGSLAGRVGVFGGSSSNGYFLNRLLSRPDVTGAAGPLQMRLFNDKDFLTTHVSYRLGLRGPSVNVQCACSTSLVAVHLACQAVLAGECEMALAGGVAVQYPQRLGYLYQEGGISSPDGHCRAYDAQAAGTVGGTGVGVVLLKRLADALADGDPIRAVVLGSAVNNDGSAKAGFTVPSVETQAEVIADALAMAGVGPETLGLVEGHGSGTPLGDPIEVEALTRAFRAGTDLRGYCALGSIKSNLGHADAAAGIAGFIKAVRAVESGLIPPTLHFESPNPRVDFPASPFFVNPALARFAEGAPRRAAVNSLGMGGTNAHVVVEEPPVAELPSESRPWQLLTVSARTPEALEQATADLLAKGELGEGALADLAHTLRVGRRALRFRRMGVVRNLQDLRDLPDNLKDCKDGGEERKVAFLFPGLGEQYAGMAAGLYREEPTFRKWLDRAAELLAGHLDVDIRELLFPESVAERTGRPGSGPDLRRLLAGGGELSPADRRLARTAYAHPAIFAVEVALARLWIEWGIKPSRLIGYSLGEYAAATLAGVLSFADALALVAARARLAETAGPGAMLAVPLPEEEVVPLLEGSGVTVAALNGPGLTVVGGLEEAVATLEASLAERGISCRRLVSDQAFHTPLMEPAGEELARLAATFKLSPPKTPVVSNVTGTWLTDAQATDPRYWADHLCRPVRFAEGLETLIGDEPLLLVEIGPGETLSTLARQRPGRSGRQAAVSSLPPRGSETADQAFLLDALGRLWQEGARPDWQGFVKHERRRRVALPPYPLERRRFAIDPPSASAGTASSPAPGGRLDPADWLLEPVWERAASSRVEGAPPERVLLVGDGSPLAEELARGLEPALVGVLEAGAPEIWGGVLKELDTAERFPDAVVCLAGLEADADHASPAEIQERTFGRLHHLARALGEVGYGTDRRSPLALTVVTQGLAEVWGSERLRPETALLLGPVRALPAEIAGLSARVVDVVLPAVPDNGLLAKSVAEELARPVVEPLIALRGRHRWVQGFRPVAAPPIADVLEAGGTFLIAGAFTEIGLTLAEALFRRCRARLVLIGPREAMERDKWAHFIGSQDERDESLVPFRRVMALENEGCELLFLPVDFSRPERVRAAMAKAQARFGAIDGAVLALPSGPPGLLQWKSPAYSAAVLASQVETTLSLSDALVGQPLRFFTLSGSNAPTVGAFGLAEGAAFSAFLDALAQKRTGEGVPVQALGWDFFRDQPILAGNAEIAASLSQGLALYGIAKEEIGPTFERALATGASRLVVSTQPLAERLAAPTAADLLDDLAAAPAVATHSRPDLPVDYREPEGEVERGIARIFAESFGIDPVGRDDNFFDLSGNSLLAVQIATRVSGLFAVKLPATALLESPTVAELAARVEEARPAPAASAAPAGEGDDDLLALLAEIEGLSSEEIDARLEASPSLGEEAR